MIKQSAFNIGQIIHHRNFNYRGVIVDVDANFQGSDEWYERNADTKPSREAPWYHVLVDEDNVITYVAEDSLRIEEDALPVESPLVDDIFEGFSEGQYQLRRSLN